MEAGSCLCRQAVTWGLNKVSATSRWVPRELQSQACTHTGTCKPRSLGQAVIPELGFFLCWQVEAVHQAEHPTVLPRGQRRGCATSAAFSWLSPFTGNHPVLWLPARCPARPPLRAPCEQERVIRSQRLCIQHLPSSWQGAAHCLRRPLSSTSPSKSASLVGVLVPDP